MSEPPNDRSQQQSDDSARVGNIRFDLPRQVHTAILANPEYSSPSLPVVLNRKPLRAINTYEVLESDLADLERASRSENDASIFTSLCMGGLISTLASWIGSTPTPISFAAYLAATLVLSLGSMVFGVRWIRARRARSRALADVKR